MKNQSKRIEKVNIPLRHKLLLRQINKKKKDWFGTNKINLLDIGASNGAFMELATSDLDDLREVAGVELDTFYENRMGNYGDVFIEDLQKGIGSIPEENYHLATLWEFIEHIEDSYSFFRNLRKLLVPKGVVALTTPNITSISRMLKGKEWIGVRDTSHRILYDGLSLKMILENCGFEILDSRAYFFPNRFGKSMDWINNLLSRIPGGGMLYIVARKK